MGHHAVLGYNQINMDKSSREKLRDENLPEDELDHIIGSFVRLQEDARLRDKWSGELAGGTSAVPPDETKVKRSTLRTLVMWGIAIAASLLLLLVFLPGLLETEGETLLAAELEGLELVSFRSSTQDTLFRTRAAVLAAFDNSDYQKAVQLAESATTLPTTTDDDLLNLGLAQLKSKKHDEAIATFTGLATRSPNYRSRADYYKALAYLKKGESDLAFSLLKQLSESEAGELSNRATELVQASW